MGVNGEGTCVSMALDPLRDLRCEILPNPYTVQNVTLQTALSRRVKSMDTGMHSET